MKPFKIGINSESLQPLGLSPFETLDWAIMNEADGVQFAEPGPGAGRDFERSFLKELAEYAEENHLFLEWGGGAHFPLDPAGNPRDLLAVNRKAAEAACALGLSAVLSRSDGPARWSPKALPPGDLIRLTGANLKNQKAMLKDLGIILAIEPHHELSTFDLVRIFEMSGTGPGECFGICLDTLSPLTMLEDPVAAVERVLPWIVATRIKDGAIVLASEGFASFAAEAGTGVVDFPGIFAKLSTLERKINLSLEDHGGDLMVPVFDPAVLSGFPDLSVVELMAVLRLAMKSQELLDEGKLTVLESIRWAEHGERRIKRGLRSLRRIVEEGSR